MRKRTHIRKSPADLRELTIRAVRFLKRERSWTNADIGTRIGYRDGQPVGKMMRGESRLLGTAETMNLSRLASAHGFDAMTDAFSSPSKVAVPVLEGSGEGWAADGCVNEEVAGVTTGAGTYRGLVLAGQLRGARQWLRRAFTWLRRCWRELDRIEQEGLARPSAGDSLPSSVSLSA